MSELVLYLNPFIRHILPYSYPSVFPFDQMVNRVVPELGLDPFKYKLIVDKYSDIIGLPQCKQTFEEMCFERAQQLNDLDGDIYVMYSGGIDSASVIVSMINTYNPAELSRVHLLMSHNSILEFPDMWPKLLDIFKGRIHSSYRTLNSVLDHAYIVTGEFGDQILGSDIILSINNTVGEDGIFSQWQRAIPPTLAKIFQTDIKETVDFIKRYEQTHEYCPFPIKTAFDWAWWFNFTNKAQHVVHRLFMFEDLGKDRFKRVHHFFYTPNWQRWSIDNHDMKIMDSLVSYKFIAKRFIIKYTGFTDYIKKRKIGSLGNIWSIRDSNFGIDSNYELMSYEQTKKFIRSH